METQIHHNSPSGNWIAFVFGVMFNLLANFDLRYIIDYTVQAIIGGLVFLVFKILGDFLTPLLRNWWAQFTQWLKNQGDDWR